ncbi:hypothetical protein BJV77DRAFT_755883 [Russula vinacea]|nr:hypothetical protein BJV77DRAFT_755883 [Russula vinacea]
MKTDISATTTTLKHLDITQRMFRLLHLTNSKILVNLHAILSLDYRLEAHLSRLWGFLTRPSQLWSFSKPVQSVSPDYGPTGPRSRASLPHSVIEALNVRTQTSAGFLPLTWFPWSRRAVDIAKQWPGAKCTLKPRFNTQATARGSYATWCIG